MKITVEMTVESGGISKKYAIGLDLADSVAHPLNEEEVAAIFSAGIGRTMGDCLSRVRSEAGYKKERPYFGPINGACPR